MHHGFGDVLRSTIAVVSAAALTAPLAVWWFGMSGGCVAAAAAVAALLSVWISTWSSRALARRGHDVASVMIGGAVRMFLSLGLVVAFVVWGQPWVPPEALLVMVPIYVVMLVTETVGAVRNPAVASANAADQTGSIIGSAARG